MHIVRAFFDRDLDFFNSNIEPSMPNPHDIHDDAVSQEVLESRTGQTDIFGKLDDELPPIRINGDALDQMRRSARAAGCSLSEYVRNKLYVGEYGMDHVLSLREQQFQRVMGIATSLHSKGDAT